MSRYWVSWYEPMPDGDWRPLTVPEKSAIPAYWCSGETMAEPVSATVCAVIDAKSESAAMVLVKKHWKPGEFRFIEEKEADFRPGDRFPWPEEKSA